MSGLTMPGVRIEQQDKEGRQAHCIVDLLRGTATPIQKSRRWKEKKKKLSERERCQILIFEYRATGVAVSC